MMFVPSLGEICTVTLQHYDQNHVRVYIFFNIKVKPAKEAKTFETRKVAMFLKIVTSSQL